MYQHLSREERYPIHSLLKAKQTISEIARQLHHAAGQVDDFDGLAHVQHKHIAALPHGTGLNHQLRSLGDGHEVAVDFGMRRGDGATVFDLLAE
jgi:hypothetical protein